ncbi:MAG TPA: helix-turn-helix domain-containing protein [Streptosporangiaceae bacterium]|nr:helix-turn-helix domain-containing protein [Streptosporangiaceae bacterium]
MEDVKLLTTPEVADLFRVHKATVARWLETGKIPGIRTPGGHLRFREDEIRALLAAAETPRLRAVDAA